jgi:hypothetical protein
VGGQGSGNWWRWQGSKATVEGSLVFPVSIFKNHLDPHTGSHSWRTRGGRESSIGYVVEWFADVALVTLKYRRDNEPVEIPIRIQTTPMHFGGERRWFTCPLIVNGVACDRRCGKLYLPPGAKYFGCRKCHRLTYVSCQEAHKADRLAQFFAPHQRDLWRELARRWETQSALDGEEAARATEP